MQESYPMNPLTVIQEARKSVPAVNYALAVAAVAAAVSITVSFVGKDRASIVLMTAMFAGMALIFLFSNLLIVPDRTRRMAGTVLLWSLMITLLIFILLTIMALVDRAPRRFNELINPPIERYSNYAILEAFQVGYNIREVEERLGRPVSAAKPITMSVQYFENGVMLWREDSWQIYVLDAVNNSWRQYQDKAPLYSKKIKLHVTPPKGLYAPEAGFSIVWQNEKLKEKIGWSVGKSVHNFAGWVQEFEYGLMIGPFPYTADAPTGSPQTAYALYKAWSGDSFKMLGAKAANVKTSDQVPNCIQ